MADSLRPEKPLQPIATQLHIRLLGGFHISYGEQVLTGFQRPKLQALLAYVLLHRGEVVPRQQLAFLFWPDSTEKQARTNIRNLLFKLRHALPVIDEYLQIERASVRWLEDAPYVLDVAEFEEDVAKAENALRLSNQRGARTFFESAIDTYGGKLLPELYDDWILVAREQLHNSYVMVLEQMVQLDEDLRDYPRAIQTSKRLLQIDPLREASYRQLMRLHALNNERATALHVYHSCVTTLSRELGVEPSPKTQRAYQRLLNLKEFAESATGSGAQLNRMIPLVGRQLEWAEIDRAWRKARAGKPQIVLIGGEAGIGKTRLAEELFDKVHRQGITALSTRSYEAEGDLAYAPITNWLRDEALSPGLAKLADVWLVEIARLMPELLEERPDLAAPGPLTEQWQQQRFYEALARAFLTGTQPILLHIDDLQWCDAETLSWLHYLLRYDHKARVLVVGTVRVEEITPDHAVRGWKYSLDRENLLTELELAPLGTDAARQLTQHTLSRELTDDDFEHLFRETEGNPFFLLETIRANWHKDEGFNVGFGSAPGETEYLADIKTIPERVRAVVNRRLAMVSPMARDVAQLAAVIGREFSYPLLAAASSRDEDSLVMGLDELWRRRVVRERGTDTYDFSHDKLREVAYDNVSPVRRRYLHGRVAQALQANYLEGSKEVIGQLAVHFERAGDHDGARRYYLQSGEIALNEYSLARARIHYQRAQALSTIPSQELDALLGLARVDFALDDLESVFSHVQQGLKLAEDGDPRRARLLYIKADAHMARYEVSQSEISVEQALAAADVSQDPETICQALSLLGQIYSSRGELDREIELITQALDISRDAQNYWREARTLADLAWLQAQRAEFDAAIVSAEQALELLRASDDQAGLAFVWNILGRAHGGKGNYEAAFRSFEQSRMLADAIDHKFFVAQVPNMLGWLNRQLCDYDLALQHDKEGLEVARSWGKTPAEISAELNVQLDYYHLGEIDRALTGLIAVQRRIEVEAFGFHAWRWRLRYLYSQGLCFLALGQRERVLEHAQEGLTLAAKTTSRKYVALNRALVGEAEAMVDSFEYKDNALTSAVALSDEIGYQPLRWQGRYRLAQLQRQAGLHYESSLNLATAVSIINQIAAGLTEVRRQRFLRAPTVQSVLQTDRKNTKEPL